MDYKKIVKECFPFAIEIIVVVLIVKFVVFLTFIPTGSMLPTIAEGGWLVATRAYNVTQSVKRGDILVFESDEMDSTLIKRVVGLPGETITLNPMNGQLSVNGEKLEEPYVVNQYLLPTQTENSSPTTISAPPPTNYEFQVPQGSYLFMGDNRAASTDSRYWYNPYIPAEKIIGKAQFTLFPLHNFGFIR